jgi:hypothetical protein
MRPKEASRLAHGQAFQGETLEMTLSFESALVEWLRSEDLRVGS